MAFGSVVEKRNLTEIEEDKVLAIKQKEIQYLTDKIAEAKQIYEHYQANVAQIEDLDKKVIDLVKIKDNLDSKVKELASQEDALKGKLIGLDKSISDYREILIDLENKSYKKYKEIKDKEAVILNLERDIEIGKQKIIDLENDINQIKVVCNATNENYKTYYKKYNEELTELEEKIKELTFTKKTLTDNLILINSELNDKASELKIKNSNILQAENEANNLIDNAKLEAEKIIMATKDEIDNKTKELNKKNGDLSIREAYLEAIEQKLRTIKLAYEEATGRRLNDINI